ncbi:hypothetical protein K2Z84_33815 [Candidatus Binatia bacterium]|nr:hypothetical protein [Candidatus Binatia bacterium]
MGVDGVRVMADDGAARSIALLALAVTLVALAAGLLLEGSHDPSPATTEQPSAQRLAPDGSRAGAMAAVGAPPESATQIASRPRLAPRRMSDEALMRALQRAEARGTIDVGEPGDRAGIAAFPAPGTKRIKRGIVVPDDFELPPGYVRHYQSTDDGHQLPAVLMFHPDFELVDADGNVVPLPADRLVPPDLAPQGLAIQLLDVPEPQIELIEPRGRREAPAPR